MDNNKRNGNYGQNGGYVTNGPRETRFQQDQQKVPQKELAHFEFNQRDFDADFPIIERIVTTTNSLCKLIGNHFKAVLNNYDGCFLDNVKINGTNMTVLSVFFREEAYTNPDKVDVISRLVQPITGSRRGRVGIDAIDRYNARYNKRQYELTEIAKEMFSEIIIPQKRKLKNGGLGVDPRTAEYSILWDQVVTELQDATMANPYAFNAGVGVLVKISFIDINKVLGKIYGTEKDGEKLIYRLTFGSPVMMKDGAANNIAIVERMKRKDSEEIVDYSGRPMFQNSIPRIH